MHAKIGDKWNILVFLFTLVSHFGMAQKPVVALGVDKKELGPDEHCTFTVSSNMEGTVKIDFPVEFNVDYGVMHGMEQKMDPSGKIKTYYYVQQSGAFKKEGTYSFYAYVSYRNKTYRSNKITLKVSESFEEDNERIRSEDPVFGVIQCKKTCVYEGEPVLVKAKVFSYLNIEYLEAYNEFKADLNAESHPFVNGRVDVESTKINGKEALTFEYGKQLLIPVATGKCRIQPFEMSLRCRGSLFPRTMNFRSSGLTLQVKPLPVNAPGDFIGAVGTYHLSQKLQNKTIKEGEVFTLELTVSGIGNLHNSNPPKLKLPKGCSLYGDPERIEDLDYTEDGVSGKIIYRYNIQVLQEKDLKIPAPGISYFDPEKEKYISIVGEPLEIHVIPDKSFDAIVNQENTPTHVDNQLVKTDKKTTINKQSKKKTNWMLTLGVPAGGAVSLLILFLFLRRGKRKEQVAATAEGGLISKPVHFLQDAESETPKREEPIVEKDYWKETETVLDDPEKFAVLLPKAIIQRVEKLECCSFQSREKAFDRLTAKNPEVAGQLRTIIEHCDLYRYGFGTLELDTNVLWKDTTQLFEQLN